MKRKQALRDRQLKERQKRIDELKFKENERRMAVEERRKKREEMTRVIIILIISSFEFEFTVLELFWKSFCFFLLLRKIS